MDCSITSYLELLIVMDLLNGFSDFEFIGFLLGGAKRDRDVLNRTKK